MGDAWQILTVPGRPVTNNQFLRAGLQTRMAWKVSVRTQAHMLAKGLRHVDRCEIHVIGIYPDRRVPDTDALGLWLKAVLDGLQEAGVIDDDSGRVVRAVHHYAPEVDAELDEPRVRVGIEEL